MEKVGGLISILIILDLISKFLISHFNIHLDLGIISIFPIETIVGYAIDNEILSVPKLTESINTTKIIYIIFATLFASVFIFSLKQKCLFENNFLSFSHEILRPEYSIWWEMKVDFGFQYTS